MLAVGTDEKGRLDTGRKNQIKTTNQLVVKLDSMLDRQNSTYHQLYVIFFLWVNILLMTYS